MHNIYNIIIISILCSRQEMMLCLMFEGYTKSMIHNTQTIIINGCSYLLVPAVKQDSVVEPFEVLFCTTLLRAVRDAARPC